jgi:hypothetical protein
MSIGTFTYLYYAGGWHTLKCLYHAIFGGVKIFFAFPKTLLPEKGFNFKPFQLKTIVYKNHHPVYQGARILKGEKP